MSEPQHITVPWIVGAVNVRTFLSVCNAGRAGKHSGIRAGPFSLIYKGHWGLGAHCVICTELCVLREHELSMTVSADLAGS